MDGKWIVCFEKLNTYKIKKEYIEINLRIKFNGKPVYYYFNKEWVRNLEDMLSPKQKAIIMGFNSNVKSEVKFTMLGEKKGGKRTRRSRNKKKRRSGTRSKRTAGKFSFYNILVVIIAMILTINLFNINAGNRKKDIENLNRVFNDEINKAFEINSSLAIGNNSTLALEESEFKINVIQDESIDGKKIISEIRDTPLLSKLVAAVSSAAVIEILRKGSYNDFLFDVVCFNIGGELKVVHGSIPGVLSKGLPTPIDDSIFEKLTKEIARSISQIYGPDKLGKNFYARWSLRDLVPLQIPGLPSAADGDHVDMLGSMQAATFGMNESLVKHPDLYNMLSANPMLKASMYGWDGANADLTSRHVEEVVGFRYLNVQDYVANLLRLTITTESDKKTFMQYDPNSTVFAQQLTRDSDGKVKVATSHFGAPSQTTLEIDQDGNRIIDRKSETWHRLLLRVSTGKLSDKGIETILETHYRENSGKKKVKNSGKNKVKGSKKKK